jgi:hypothetical protein
MPDVARNPEADRPAAPCGFYSALAGRLIPALCLPLSNPRNPAKRSDQVRLRSSGLCLA